MFLMALSLLVLSTFWFFWVLSMWGVAEWQNWSDSHFVMMNWVGLGVGGALIFGVILLANSPLAEGLLRWLTGSRRSIERERAVLLPLIETVQADVLRQCGYKQKTLKLWIIDEPMPQAWAIGKRTLIISRGLYEQATPEQLQGVVAHELGHLHAGDSRQLSIAVFLSTVVMGLLAVGSVLAAVLSAFAAIRGKYLAIIALVALLCLPFLLIPLWAIRGCNGLLGMILHWTSRKQEYAADQFAVRAGYGAGLLDFFDLIKDVEWERPSMMERLFSTHPPVMLRVDAVEQALKTAVAIQK